MSADQSDPEMLECEGHGTQIATLVCIHLAESDHGDTSLGFHCSVEDGDYIANCDDCEAQCDDEGFFPDDLVEETFVSLCKGCLEEIAKSHGVVLPPLPEGGQTVN